MSLLCNIHTEEGSENAEESNIQASANCSFAVETNIQEKRTYGEVETEVESQENEEGSEDAVKSKMQASANISSAEDTNLQKKRSYSEVETELESQENEESVEDAGKSSMQVSVSISSAEYINIQKKRPYGEVESELESQENEESVEDAGKSSMQVSVEFEAGSHQITTISKIQPLEPDAHKPVVNMYATLDEKIPVTELSTETTTKITLTVMNHREIMYQLRRLEADLVRPIPRYINKRRYLNMDMRNNQVNFLMHVFKNVNEQILHKAVYFMDSYLSHRDILMKEPNIFASAAGLLACQFEKECFQTNIDWIEITGNTFTERELLQKKEMIKTELNNRLERPTIISFIRHIYSVATVATSAREDFLVKYICDLTLIGDVYVGFPPSLMACTAVALARHTVYCNDSMWPREFRNITGYKQYQLHETFSFLHRTLQRAATEGRYAMVKSKFMEANYGRIAVIKEVIKPKEFDPRIFF